MENLKLISNKEIYELEDNDVLRFLIYKDVNDSGRAVVHHFMCQNVGTAMFRSCSMWIEASIRIHEGGHY